MSTDDGKVLVKTVLEQGRYQLSEHEATRVLAAYGIPTAREQLVDNLDNLASALRAFQWPVVLKIDSPDILHKTEAGLVTLNCRSLQEAEQAFVRLTRRARERYPQAALHGVLVQEMITEATECIVGMRRDEQFGPAIVFGLGGIFVEVYQDITLRVAPLTKEDASRMVRSIKGYPILAGARGRPPADLEAIEDILLKLSQLSLALEDYVTEIDVNPLMVGSLGRPTKAADALIVMSEK